MCHTRTQNWVWACLRIRVRVRARAGFSDGGRDRSKVKDVLFNKAIESLRVMNFNDTFL